MKYKKLKGLSPSSAHRWMSCTASAHLYHDNYDEVRENNKTKYSDRGNNLHEHAAIELAKKFKVNYELPNKLSCISSEDFELVEKYVSYINKEAPIDADIYIEKKLSIDDMQINGIIDSFYISEHEKIMHIIDYKAGRLKVSAKMNEQLMIYAIMAYRFALQKNILIDKIKISIIQPLIYNFDHYLITPFMLNVFINILSSVLYEIHNKPKFYPSHDNCKYCYFKKQCKSYIDFNMINLNRIKKMLDSNSAELGNEEISNIMHIKKSIEDFFCTIENISMERIIDGQKIDGVSLEKKSTHRKWIDEGLAIQYLSKFIDEKSLFDNSLLSPSKIEKIIKGTKADISKLVCKKDCGLKIVIN